MKDNSIEVGVRLDSSEFESQLLKGLRKLTATYTIRRRSRRERVAMWFAQWPKRRKARRFAKQIAGVKATLNIIDLAMRVNGMSRQQRRGIWREIAAGRIDPQDLM